MLIHKETFRQAADSGVPQHWVVQYWEDEPFGFCEASYFSTLKDAAAFEETLTAYDDWYTSQEEPLPTQ